MRNLLSYSSVRLDLFSRDGLPLKPACGFVVEDRDRHYLVTNRHVLSGTDLSSVDPQPPVTAPYLLKTAIHSHGGQGEQRAPIHAGAWQRITIPLYDKSGAPTWFESRAKEADLAALPIQLKDFARLTQSLRAFMSGATKIDLSGEYWTRVSAIPVSAIDTDVEYGPPDPVHVIGYPPGWAPAGLEKASSAFWRTGRIASEIHEPGVIHGNVFFIDPRAPQGMSGSPVVGLKNDQIKLLGIYSDRALPEAGPNGGLVWEAWLIKGLIGTS
jgi:hypothetical protein